MRSGGWRQAKPKSQFAEYIESLIAAIVIALALRFFVISAYKIPTGSMIPTLKVGDYIFAYRLPYGLPIPFAHGAKWGSSLPERGDVIVFRYPGNEAVNYVKRVVGLPGDKILIKNKQLFINDTPAEYRPWSDDVIRDLPGHEFYSAAKETFGTSSHIVIRNREAAGGETFGPVIVPPDHVFVLGDNRDSSDDSRYWGAVPLKNLEGRVVMVWMSLDWLDRWGDERYPTVRWNRVFRGIR